MFFRNMCCILVIFISVLMYFCISLCTCSRGEAYVKKAKVFEREGRPVVSPPHKGTMQNNQSDLAGHNGVLWPAKFVSSAL